MTQPAQTNNQMPGGLPPLQNIESTPNNFGQQLPSIQQTPVQQPTPIAQQPPVQQPIQQNTFNPGQFNQVTSISSNNQNKPDLLPRILMVLLVMAILGEAVYIVYTLFIK